MSEANLFNINFKLKDFTHRLELCEARINTLESNAPHQNELNLKQYLKHFAENLVNFLRESSGHINTELPILEKELDACNSATHKITVLSNQIQSLKIQLLTKQNYANEIKHTDILYIYWHSMDELNELVKLSQCLEFLEKEISKLEAAELKFNSSPWMGNSTYNITNNSFKATI